MTQRTDGVRVEWLILADAAQIMGNKLYLMGGGWDSLTLNQPMPVDHHMAVAMSLLVPWNATNQRHNFEVEIITDDGKSLATINGQVEAGRPQGVKPGQEQRTQIAFNVGLRLEKAGGYSVVARMNGQEQGRTVFNVASAPAAMKRSA